MSAEERNKSSSGASTYLMVPIAIFFGLLIFSVIRGPGLITSAGIGSAIIVVAPLVLATYALTIIVMAGRAGVDLSMGPLIGFINVSLIQLVGIGFMDSPIAVFLFAMAAGIAYQILMGLIIIYVRVQPIIVSLSGYLALVGLNLIIMPRPGGLAPEWMLDWGSGTTIFSPVLVILIVATIGWYLLATTAFFGNLKMMGSDERATYTSGVNINMVRLGAHVIGGIYAGLAALTFTSLISSGDPTQGTTYTLMAVTALVLGGANLAGGRGSAFGSLLGALNIYLITFALSTFNFGLVQSFVTDLAYGVMLVVSLLISVSIPALQKRAKNLSPIMFFMILAMFALGVIVHVAMDHLPVAESLVPYVPSFGVVEPVAGEEGSYSAGTYFLFIILGIAIIAYVIRTFLKYSSAAMTGLIVLLIIGGLGLIFNPGEPDADAASAVSDGVVTGNVNDAITFFAMETFSESNSAFSIVSISQSIYLLMAIVGVILLATLIILIMLPQVAIRTKRISMILFATVTAVLAIAALFFQDADKGYLISNFSGEIIAVALVGSLLFAITAPLVQTKLHNISNLFIGVIGVLAVICMYFFSGSNEISTDQKLSITYSSPVLATAIESKVGPAIDYPSPVRMEASESGSGGMPLYAELAYFGFIIVLLHIFLRIAMEETSFRSFWRYWHIAAFSTLAWSALFFIIGIALWKIILVIVLAMITAPNIMHIISTYVVGDHRDDAISQWED